MMILGLETSCDETSAAILRQDKSGIHILSNVVASSAVLQSKYGGIIPEQAAREQIKSIIPVIKESLKVAKCKVQDIDAIAVTQGPGLIGSLLVGVETAKVLAKIWHKPLIPVNHLIGHFYANWIDNSPQFPCLGLLVSGGHTDLVLFSGHGKYKYLGGTRDDAAGECFDKCARLLNLPYPGGPQISKLAKKGNSKAFKLPRPMLDSKDLDLSFSGLKTAVSNLVKREDTLIVQSPLSAANTESQAMSGVERLFDLCAYIEAAIIDCLVKKTVAAIQLINSEELIVAGGVAANPKLTEELKKALPGINIHVPTPSLCTDNGAMIASAAFFTPDQADSSLQANPNLSLAY